MFSSSSLLLPLLWLTKPPLTMHPTHSTMPPNTKTPHPLTTMNMQLRMTTVTPLFTLDKTNTETDTPPTDSKFSKISCLFTICHHVSCKFTFSDTMFSNFTMVQYHGTIAITFRNIQKKLLAWLTIPLKKKPIHITRVTTIDQIILSVSKLCF